MFSMSAEVVGIVSHIISKSGGSEGLGFVVTSNMARRLLLERKSVWSGFSGHFLSGDLARAFNLPQPTGLLVQRVAANSPAARIGLRAGVLKAILPSDGTELTLGGDVILQVQGIPVGEAGIYERVQADPASSWQPDHDHGPPRGPAGRAHHAPALSIARMALAPPVRRAGQLFGPATLVVLVTWALPARESAVVPAPRRTSSGSLSATGGARSSPKDRRRRGSRRSNARRLRTGIGSTALVSDSVPRSPSSLVPSTLGSSSRFSRRARRQRHRDAPGLEATRRTRFLISHRAIPPT
jgi:hypothetical protein